MSFAGGVDLKIGQRPKKCHKKKNAVMLYIESAKEVERERARGNRRHRGRAKAEKGSMMVVHCQELKFSVHCIARSVKSSHSGYLSASFPSSSPHAPLHRLERVALRDDTHLIPCLCFSCILPPSRLTLDCGGPLAVLRQVAAGHMRARGGRTVKASPIRRLPMNPYSLATPTTASPPAPLDASRVSRAPCGCALAPNYSLCLPRSPRPRPPPLPPSGPPSPPFSLLSCGRGFLPDPPFPPC